MLHTVGSSCSGVVVSNSHGQVLGACTSLHQHVSSAFAIEILAFITIIDFARGLGLSQVVFEGDSLHVICKLCNLNEDRLEIRALINEGKQRLVTGFATVEIKHRYREQNSIAHQLASLGVSLAFGSILGRGGTFPGGTHSCCRD
ncbi:hypothetical protein J1N35_037887 [Gossypium stocksii]|uniref:RNase H type-1 domain-containing protein n=1 Tax=Gossypium stocksii TaxID=47602 RepID=A0A9D3ZM51_9ROSI|nr:hypothetical protein J1N35_037887 [Gossypium stocksii]